MCPMSASLTSVVEELDNLFAIFNETLFENKLVKPVITVSPGTTKGAYGWCTSWKAWQDEVSTEGFYEINLCAEYLNRPFDKTCSTLIHEMVHLWNLQRGIQDTSRFGNYHNKSFKEAAETHGLIVEEVAPNGFCKTTLAPKTLGFIQSLGMDKFSLVRPKVSREQSKAKQSFRKYVCPGCGAIIRATKEVHVICGDCSLTFHKE